MGLYTGSSRYGEYTSAYDYAAEIPMDEAYASPFGAAQALVDCQLNDMALFEGALMDDIDEVESYNEGYDVMNEAVDFSGILNKIKELFKKLIAKIKGIFSSFLTKMAGAFKSGKNLVKDYRKDIVSYTNWKGFNLKKVRKPKSWLSTASLSDAKEKKRDADSRVKAGGMDAVYRWSAITDKSSLDHVEGGIDNSTHDEADIKGVGLFDKDKDSEEMKDEILKKEGCTNISWDSFDDDWKDTHWDDEEDYDGEDDIKSGSFFTTFWIEGILEGGEKYIEAIKKKNSKTEKHINNIIDSINNLESALKDSMTQYTGNNVQDTITGGKYYSGVDTFDFSTAAYKTSKSSKSSFVKQGHEKGQGNKQGDADKIMGDKRGFYYQQFVVQRLQVIASNHQTVLVRINNAELKDYKDLIAQARAIWTKAAAWTKRTHKEESTEYFDAVYDVALQETYSNFDSLY